MFRPQLPPNPTLQSATPAVHEHAPAQQHQHTTAHVAPARRSLPPVSTGAIAAVLVGGVVLTALLTAVAVSAISVAVAAVVLRSLLHAQHRHR